MTRYRKLSTSLMLLTATTLAGVALAAPQGIPGPNPDAPGQIKKANGPTINTTDGPVRGFVENGVTTFLGIPYAAPPTGNLRWMPPAPPAHHALLDATEFANTCPQVTELGAFAGPTSTTEDCLYLNVFTTGTSPAKPVLVWIHGGGNIDGESNDYDASKLATSPSSPTVVVTMNYRMGLFGYLAHPALNSEGHLWGNYGTLDIQAVLRWVKANIAAFGGDPTKVALGGQSAGARNTSANVVSPLAAGLFNRAIVQSSPWASTQTLALALQRGTDFAVAAGCPGSGATAASCLRNLSAERILQLQGTPNASGPYTTNGVFVDGTIVPTQPEVAWTSGHYNHMPIMGGSVKDEGNFGISITEYFSGPPQAPMTLAQYTTAITNAYGANAPLVLAQYPPVPTPQEAYNRVTTDPGKCSSLHVLKLQASTNTGFGVYGYDFTYRNAPYYFPKMPSFTALAAHTIDIQFLFSGYHGGQLGVNLDQATGQPRELQGSEIGLSDQLVAAWTNFAKTGNPNGAGAPVWPVFTTTGPFLQQDIPNGTETEAQYRANYKCDFWDTLLTYPTT